MPITYMCDRCGATLDRSEARKLIWFGGEPVGVYCDECKPKINDAVARENLQ